MWEAIAKSLKENALIDYRQLVPIPYGDTDRFCQRHGHIKSGLFGLSLVIVGTGAKRGTNMDTFVITWVNVLFHHSLVITNWFADHQRTMMTLLFYPIRDFPQPQWVFFLQPGGGRCSTINHMTKCTPGCSGCFSIEDCQGWMWHASISIPGAWQKKTSVMWMKTR